MLIYKWYQPRRPEIRQGIVSFSYLSSSLCSSFRLSLPWLCEFHTSDDTYFNNPLPSNGLFRHNIFRWRAYIHAYILLLISSLMNFRTQKVKCVNGRTRERVGQQGVSQTSSLRTLHSRRDHIMRAVCHHHGMLRCVDASLCHCSVLQLHVTVHNPVTYAAILALLSNDRSLTILIITKIVPLVNVREKHYLQSKFWASFNKFVLFNTLTD
jgi:hypothetical protein